MRLLHLSDRAAAENPPFEEFKQNERSGRGMPDHRQRFLLDGEDIYNGMDVNILRKRVGMVFQKPNPFPMSIYDNIAYGPRTHGIRSKAKLDEIVEKSLRDAAIWDEVKDRLKKVRSACPVDSSRDFVSQGHLL